LSAPTVVHVPEQRWRGARYFGVSGAWTQYACPFCERLLRLQPVHRIDRWGRVTPAARCVHEGCGRVAMLLLMGWAPDQTPTERSEDVVPPPLAEVESG
jgi:hypothetical protein